MPFKLRTEFQLATLNVKKYKKDFAKELRDANLTAVLEWLIEATTRVPIWSGASIATFSGLTDAIGFAVGGGIKPGVRSRTSLGKSQSKSSVIEQLDRPLVGFRYQTRLSHLIYNNFFNANVSPDSTLFSRLLQPGPYNFDKPAAQAALEQYRKIRPPDLQIKIRKIGTK